MAHRIPPLRSGHHLQLLEGSRELFPAMIAAIELAARWKPLHDWAGVER